MNIIDFHVDTLMRLYEINNQDNSIESLLENKACVDINRLIKSNYMAQFFACFLDMQATPYKESHYNDALEMIEMFSAEIKKNCGKIAYAGSYADYIKNKAESKLSGFLTIEEGGIIENNIERLDELYHKGVRLITLTWNYENCIGYPNHEYKFQNKGLKPFGFECLKRMEDLGIIVDVSHLSDAGFDDVYDNCKRPFIATHSNSRNIQEHNRNLTDEMIKKVSDKGGVIGLNFSGSFLEPEGRSTIESMLKHMRHIINMGGSGVLCLGTDFDGIECDLELKGVEDMPKLVEAMEKNKFSSNDIEGICYKNAETFLERYFE